MALNLYVFYVGGMLPGRKIENHDIVLAIGQTVEDCYDQIKAQCTDFSGLHIDSYTLYDGIFGLRIDIVDSKLAINNVDDESLYLCYIGVETPGSFVEKHILSTGKGKSASEVKAKMKAYFSNEEYWRSDGVLDSDRKSMHVDNMIKLESPSLDFILVLVPDSTYDNRRPSNIANYIPLS